MNSLDRTSHEYATKLGVDIENFEKAKITLLNENPNMDYDKKKENSHDFVILIASTNFGKN